MKKRKLLSFLLAVMLLLSTAPFSPVTADAADVKVNTSDVGKINAHAKEKKLLW